MDERECFPLSAESTTVQCDPSFLGAIFIEE